MADEEELEDESLHFGAGADNPGMAEFRTSGSGMGTDVCAWLDCDFEALEFSGSVRAGIPCICCEQHKVLEEVIWGWVDSMEKELQALKQNQVRCILTNNQTFYLGIVSDHCTVHTCAMISC